MTATLTFPTTTTDETAERLRMPLLRTVADAPADELPAVVGVLAHAQALALSRLQAPRAPAGAAEPPDRQLTPEQGAEMLGVSKVWLLRHTRRARFRHDHSRKMIRFDEAGLRRWWTAARRP